MDSNTNEIKEFCYLAANIYIKTCNIDVKSDSLGILKSLPQLIKLILCFDQVLCFDQANNIDELFYFFVLSKRFYEKIKFDSKNWFLEFVALWSLTEMFLQDKFYELKRYFFNALYLIYYVDKNLFEMLFENYCYIFSPFTKPGFLTKSDYYLAIVRNKFFNIKKFRFTPGPDEFTEEEVFFIEPENILEREQRRVLYALEFNLNVAPQEIEQFKGFFYE